MRYLDRGKSGYDTRFVLAESAMRLSSIYCEAFVHLDFFFLVLFLSQKYISHRLFDS